MKDSASLDFNTGIDIVYSAADDSYTLTDRNGSHVPFTPADIVPSDPGIGGVKYRIDVPNNVFSHTDFTRFVPKVNGVPLSYTLMGIWHQDYGQVIDVMVGGVPTQAGNLPTSGSAIYQAAVVSGAALTSGAGNSPVISYDLGSGGSTATFSADFGPGTVQTTIGLRGMDSKGATNDLGTLTGDGTISATAPTFAGTLSQAGGSGAFSGAFLGPQAAEMGYGFYFESADFTAIGLVAGKKK